MLFLMNYIVCPCHFLLLSGVSSGLKIGNTLERKYFSLFLLPGFFSAAFPLIVVGKWLLYYLIIVLVLFDVVILLLRKLLLEELTVGVPQS